MIRVWVRVRVRIWDGMRVTLQLELLSRLWLGLVKSYGQDKFRV